VPWQAAYLADPAAFRLVRACNQVGKTTTVCDEIVDLIRGEHVRPRPWTGPINVTLISESIEQMAQEGAILEKLWEVLPKHELDPDVWFERGRGLRGVKYPAIRFVSGPGAGSVIRLRTYNQGPEALAGSTIHAVYCDEPCPENVYSELAPRLLRHHGWFTITFTPVPGDARSRLASVARGEGDLLRAPRHDGAEERAPRGLRQAALEPRADREVPGQPPGRARGHAV
jgi:phage terminase large subunit-like protein